MFINRFELYLETLIDSSSSHVCSCYHITHTSDFFEGTMYDSKDLTSLVPAFNILLEKTTQSYRKLATGSSSSIYRKIIWFTLGRLLIRRSPPSFLSTFFLRRSKHEISDSTYASVVEACVQSRNCLWDTFVNPNTIVNFVPTPTLMRRPV
jgi:hypothetical protein